MERPLILLLMLTLATADEICLSGEEDPYLFFGTKTAYIFANRGLPNIKTHDVPGCSPIAFWLLNRHGSVNPEVDEVKDLEDLVNLRDNIISNYNNHLSDIDNRLCAADLALLKKWQWNAVHNVTFAGQVTTDGYMSTQQLARAWRQKYRGLLTSNTYNYLYKFAQDKRSELTFRAFTEGLFGAQAETFDIPKENDEKLTNPFKNCPAWTKNVEENNETLAQRDIFEKKMDYRNMITQISRRLGFSYDINNSSIKAMYKMCSYEKAWDITNISPWCAVFTKDDLKRLEYAEDLETYYKYGYGQPLYRKMGCLPVKDMYNFFSNHISKELPQLPLSMITFTDAALLLTTLAALNTHQDQAPPTGDNFNFLNGAQARKWTTSTMAPYNGNLAAALYKCTPNGNFQIKEQYQVLFLENEKPMYMEGCRVGLCDWSLVKNRFAGLVANCDLEFCNGAAKTSFGFAIVIGLLISQLSNLM